MGVLIKCKNEVFNYTVGRVEYPKISTLENLYFLGGNAGKTTEDHSGNNHTATIGGTVLYETNYATFDGNNLLNRMIAQIPDQTETSIAATALVKKTGNRGIIGNASASNTPKGFVFGTQRLIYATNGAWKDLQFTLPDSDNFYVIGMIISSGGAKVYKYDANGLGIIATKSDANVSLDNNLPICIGGTNYNWSFSGKIDLSAIAYYEGIVTENQIQTAMEYLRDYAGLKGLSVN